MTQTPTDALRLVPVEPTEEMIEAGNRALSSWIAPAMHAGDAYAAMIKEIPTVVPTMPNRDGIAERIFDCPEVRGEFDMETARKVADFILAAAPASPLPGGGPYERWSILNHLGESWTPENFDTERQATAFLDRWKRDNPKMDLSKHKVIPVLVTMTAAPTGEPK